MVNWTLITNSTQPLNLDSPMTIKGAILGSYKCDYLDTDVTSSLYHYTVQTEKGQDF